MKDLTTIGERDVFLYQGDLYCEECGNRLCDDLLLPTDPADETSYDSDDYPKGPYKHGGGEADSPQHCGAVEECINSIEVGGIRVGCWLTNPLTDDGVEYVREAVKAGSEVAKLWAKWYADYLQ